MPKTKRATHQAFEGYSERGQFTKICRDMMQSKAWQVLNLRQQGLYLLLKSKYTQKVTHGIIEKTNRDNISFPKSEWTEYYGDYRTFSHDMELLVNLGFIRIVERGKCTRTPNIYGFTTGWKEYPNVKNRPDG
ncbi:MAG: hypothetical protein VB087_05890 [Candidatus Limiplasma sp.]|nr:hypothetical protein [Candidatus Limiplasma sp.]